MRKLLTAVVAAFALWSINGATTAQAQSETTYNSQVPLTCRTATLCTAAWPVDHAARIEVHFVKCYLVTRGDIWRTFLRYHDGSKYNLLDLVPEIYPPIFDRIWKRYIWHQTTLYRIPAHQQLQVHIWLTHGLYLGQSYCSVFGKRIPEV